MKAPTELHWRLSTEGSAIPSVDDYEETFTNPTKVPKHGGMQAKPKVPARSPRRRRRHDSMRLRGSLEGPFPEMGRRRPAVKNPPSELDGPIGQAYDLT